MDCLLLCENSDEETSVSCSVSGEKYSLKEWHSSWGCRAVVDDVAPLFEQILRENYASSSNFLDEDSEENCKIWWSWRENLDNRLHKLLRDMEESWFGAWRYLLLGRWLDCEPLNSVVRELVCDIKLRYKYGVHEGVLKLVLGGIKPANLDNEGIPSLFLQKGCYIGCIEDRDGESCNSPNEECDGADYVPAHIVELMLTAVSKLEAEYCMHRKPVILVLDINVQMLPLESMPILTEQEVYRMPSVAIVFATLQRRCFFEEAAGEDSRFPLIDPLDAFYLLNPSGDLSRTEAEFEPWFRRLNMRGKTGGGAPSKEELTGALGNHDLFYYLGHGSGKQYMTEVKIQDLEKCAGMLLMGCSSASLALNGDYPPVGPPLSYILAGSPNIVGTLWEVTDREIDRFTKALLKAFLDERSTSLGCKQCSILAEEFKSMSVNERKGNTKKGRGRKKKPESEDGVLKASTGYCFTHKLRAGYFVSQARKACRLQFMIGAAPVCYGVPTGIRKKISV